MDITKFKQWDKSSRKYRFAKWLYLNFLFYFINVDTFGKSKKLYKIIGGQHFDLEQMDGFIKPWEGVVVDVGAERGEVARHFYLQGFKVYVIEPEKKNVRYLWLHHFFKALTGRFKIFRLACADNPGVAQLQVSDLSFRHSLVTSQYASGEVQKVKQVRIGDFINAHHLQKIAVLKVDAEGFDLPILKGLFNSTQVRPKIIMFEAEPENIKELIELMRQNSYNYFRFVCRWPEAPEVSAQKRIAVYDGFDPEILTANSNVICLQKDFRSAYPLKII